MTMLRATTSTSRVSLVGLLGGAMASGLATPGQEGAAPPGQPPPNAADCLATPSAADGQGGRGLFGDWETRGASRRSRQA